MTSLPFKDLPFAGPSEIHSQGCFEDFWPIYPRKVARIAAAKAYCKARKSASHAEIMAGLQRYLQTKPAYADWCHPATWLNQGRWMDEPDAPAKPTGPYTLEALAIIAAHVKRPWCERGAYSRDVLEQCVAAGLISESEKDAAL